MTTYVVARTCNHEMRGGDLCQLDAGHRGRHSTVFFMCDGCGKRRRGTPYRYLPDGEYEKGLGFCFPCVCEDERKAEAQGAEY